MTLGTVFADSGDRPQPDSAIYDLRDAITVVRVHAQLARRRLAQGRETATAAVHSLDEIEQATRTAEWALRGLELQRPDAPVAPRAGLDGNR